LWGALIRIRSADPAELSSLLERLDHVCERFSAAVRELTENDLARIGVHAELGPLTMADCIRLPLEAADLHKAQLIAALGS